MPAMAPPGHEGVARIVELGKEVTGLQIGQRVCCGHEDGEFAAGAFSTCRNLPASNVYPLPECDLADEFWLVEPVSCAVTGLDHSRIKVADKIVLLGCGFMGLIILQGLCRSFASEVIALDISESRLAKARELGAGEVHDLASPDAEAMLADLEGRGIDTVIDTTGVGAAFNTACRIVKPNGLVNHFGWVKSSSSEVDLSRIHLKGIQIASTPPVAQMRDPFPAAIDAIHRGIFDLRPLVSHVVSLADYPELMSRIQRGEPAYLKGVVRL